MYITEKRNSDLLELGDQKLFDLSCIETQQYHASLGEDAEDIKIKDVYTYVNSKPYPYTPTGIFKD